jgi:bifunctional non-homologous end joining protein LigD
MGNRKQTSRLDPYRAKRSAQRTPEPFGSEQSTRPRLFCVQKHAARRLHYDFRLEWGGTLWSWAVPKGPSPDPAVNRLAVQVEDHPVEYADFEGVIPSGNYGAGAVIVWDRGLWVPLDDPDALAATGKLHFELHGYKLRGTWLLIRTRDKEWLLRKKQDAWATNAADPYSEESVLSGLTLEELRDGHGRAADTRAALVRLGAPRRDIDPAALELTLAETAPAPFSAPEWIFELKYDGYRAVAARPGGEPFLRSRNGNDFTPLFPEVARGLRALPYDGLVLDGEIVVTDAAGRPDFQRLQGRAQLRRPAEVDRAAVEQPATYFVFDLLGFEGYDLRGLPLVERKQLLQPLLPRAGPLRYADHVVEQGEAMFEHVRELGLEGILAKRADSAYVGRRTPHWLKIVVERSGDFVVCGMSAPRGSRAGFGALHLGVFENGVLVYAGRVGTGFDDTMLRRLRAELDPLVQPDPPLTGPVPAEAGDRWVRPERVAEVRYKEVTDEGLLRAPVFVRMRSDKRPEECVREPVARPATPPTAAAPRAGFAAAGRRRRDARSPATPPAAAAAPPAAREIHFSNLDKVFWPADGTTKGDLIDYYRRVSPWLLPYLRDRPLVLTRYPDGIEGKSFYQKNAPEFVPGWIRRVQVWSDSSEREIEYFVCDDEDALLYIVNMGAIPLHIWPSRADTLQNPDWCILDLDPKGAPFAHVVQLARSIHTLCDEIGLPSYVKTTGSTGLHILVPLGRQCTFEQSRQLGQLVSRLIEADHPDISTTRRNPAARGGRVYLDFLQNRHGQLLAAPYSVRPLPGAPVSAPLDWREVTPRLTPQKFHIRNLPQRLERMHEDPLRPLLVSRPDLIAALEALAARIEARS